MSTFHYFIEDALDFLIPLLCILLFVAAIIGGIFVMAHVYGSYASANYAEITGKETRFAAFDSCYVKTADGWQRWDEYRVRAAASEGLKGAAR